jgi:hypothetical protein
MGARTVRGSTLLTQALVFFDPFAPLPGFATLLLLPATLPIG